MNYVRFAKSALISIALATFATSGLAQTQKASLYPEKADAKADIQAALDRAGREKKRVILDFGADWCGDCHALDEYFHKEPNASLLKKNFILVEVNIGRWNENLDLAKKYEVPLDKGVPALAVLDSHGKVVYSQKKGEFESMRTMDISSVTDFLNHWRR